MTTFIITSIGHYTGFAGVSWGDFFSGKPYKNVAVKTPQVPKKKKLKYRKTKNI